MINQEKFTNVSVLGAAGKMGSGILLLNALYVSDLAFKPENKGKVFVINAIDVSDEALSKLLQYVRTQLLKHAEKNINLLRGYYADRADLIENSDIIPQFVNDVVGMIRLSTNLEVAYNSHLVFEAVTEKIEVKAMLLNQIKSNSKVDPWFLTNTSSIPIQVINEKARLEGNIIGCHFYNPPAVQKLIEVIQFNEGNKELESLVAEMAKSLRKTIVPANDVAGFIGNGVFIREIVMALKMLKKLQEKYSFAESVAILDVVSRDLLLRPMGIFQLIDYVGVDVCHFIIEIMSSHLNIDLPDETLVKLIDLKVQGGQYSNGSQKDGFFKYERGRSVAAYQPDSGEYVTLDSINNSVLDFVGTPPQPLSWKALSRDRGKDEKLNDYFNDLRNSSTKGAELAGDYLDAMKEIGQSILDTKVSENSDDVNKVMVTGFHQLYGPINKY